MRPLLVLVLATVPVTVARSGFCAEGTSKCCHAQTPGSCNEAKVGKTLERAFERLSFEFDKCSSCRDLWEQILCAASCMATRERASVTNTTTNTLRISQGLCENLFDACSDDDTLGKRLIAYRYRDKMTDFVRGGNFSSSWYSV